MKKLMVLMLIGTMGLNLVACGSDKNDNGNTDTTISETQNTEQQNTAQENMDTENDKVDEGVSENNSNANESETMGTTLQSAFLEQMEANPEATAQEIADGLLANEAIKFSGVSMPVETGLLTGFNNAEITGFSEGAMFAPMIGSIPFVGYIFVLEDGADVEGFVATLKDNANPRWNICTEAEETIVDYVGKTVFFVMCPKQMEE